MLDLGLAPKRLVASRSEAHNAREAAASFRGPRADRGLIRRANFPPVRQAPGRIEPFIGRSGRNIPIGRPPDFDMQFSERRGVSRLRPTDRSLMVRSRHASGFGAL